MRRCVTADFRLLSGALPPGIRAAGVRAPHRLVDARTRQVIALLLLAENAAFATPTVDGVDGDAMTIDVEHLAPELEAERVVERLATAKDARRFGVFAKHYETGGNARQALAGPSDVVIAPPRSESASIQVER